MISDIEPSGALAPKPSSSLTASSHLPGAEMRFKVLVDDNFHFMDESERYTLGTFPSLEEAIAACRKIVEDFLVSAHKPGISAANLISVYKDFGEDPWIASGDGKTHFSAWDYAERRCHEMCDNRFSSADERK